MKPLRSQISVKGFTDAFTQGMAGIEMAAFILAELIDRDGTKVYQEILASNPNCNLNLIASLERVGRGVIPLQSLYDSSPAASRIRALPPAQQKEVYANPVKVAQISNGKKVVIEKPVRELTLQECRIVFADGKLNGPKEQLQKLDEIAKPLQSARAQRYDFLNDGSIHVLAETVFTPGQLEELAAQSKDRAIKSLKK